MSPFENADYGGTQPSIDNIGGLDFTTMTNNEIIRKKDNDEAEGAGHIIEDQVAGENYIKKLYNRINSSPFSIPLGGILHSYNILTSIYKTQIAPKTSSLGSSEGLFIKSSFSDGNVDIGINVLDPQTELDVKGDIQLGNVTPKLKFGKIAPGPHALAEIKAVLNGNGGDLQFLTKVDGVVESAVTEKMRINDLGAVGFGGGNFGSDGQFLMSKGDGAVPVWTSDVDTALNTKVNNDQAIVRINEVLYISDNNTNNSFLLMYNSNRSLVISGIGSGSGTLTAGTITATSDDRIKSRTTDISNATETLLKLKPIKYEKHIDLRVPEGVEDADLSGVDHHTEMGFNSQDIQKIPELEFIVIKNEKTDLLSINYIQLIALLTKSIQEQNERIKKLEEK